MIFFSVGVVSEMCTSVVNIKVYFHHFVIIIMWRTGMIYGMDVVLKIMCWIQKLQNSRSGTGLWLLKRILGFINILQMNTNLGW